MKRSEAEARQRIIKNLDDIDLHADALQILDEIKGIFDDEARDMHGVFYSPQSFAQRVACALGHPAPDDIDDE